MARVFFTRAARDDLIDIWTHIAEDDPSAADRVLDRLDEVASHLADNPQMGPARDDIRPGLRYLVSGSYLLLYRIVGDDIEIVRAVHGRRDLYGALLHKSADGRTSPFPGQTYPATSVMGVPSAVNPFRTATRTWNSAT